VVEAGKIVFLNLTVLPQNYDSGARTRSIPLHKALISKPMLKHVLIFGLVGGALVVVLRFSEYRFLVVEHSFELYAALIAAIFAAFGIWLGLRLNASHRHAIAVAAPQPAGEPFKLNEKRRDELSITAREIEILGLVAAGLSNREIADRLHVTENTVKTHCSRAFDKLGAKRRTQAVQLGKEFGLIP